MNSKKLWHALILITMYCAVCALVSFGVTCLLNAISWHWAVALGLGIAFWIVAVVFLFVWERKMDYCFLPVLPCCAVACGLFIAAYNVGTGIAISLPILLLLVLSCALCYLVFMAILTVPHFSGRLWFLIVAYIVWMAGSVLLHVFVMPNLLKALGFVLPKRFWMYILFFILLLGFLSLGSIFDVDGFGELTIAMATPALIVTCIVAVIAIIAVAGDGDCGDCCGDSCGECCDCSGGYYNGTTYDKKKQV